MKTNLLTELKREIEKETFELQFESEMLEKYVCIILLNLTSIKLVHIY